MAAAVGGDVGFLHGYSDGLTKPQWEREWGGSARHASRASGADELCAPPRGVYALDLDKAFGDVGFLYFYYLI